MLYLVLWIIWTIFRADQRNIRNEMQSIKTDIVGILKEFTKINKK
jgi:hypothetical protein